jgi:hypothetical protein
VSSIVGLSANTDAVSLLIPYDHSWTLSTPMFVYPRSSTNPNHQLHSFHVLYLYYLTIYLFPKPLDRSSASHLYTIRLSLFGLPTPTTSFSKNKKSYHRIVEGAQHLPAEAHHLFQLENVCGFASRHPCQPTLP